jgi:hypothetical protein
LKPAVELTAHPDARITSRVTAEGLLSMAKIPFAKGVIRGTNKRNLEAGTVTRNGVLLRADDKGSDL